MISTKAQEKLYALVEGKDTFELLSEATESHEGICLACGEIQDGCEPDATEYNCHSCNQLKVMGLETALMTYI